jgi:hypothetical protein
MDCRSSILALRAQPTHPQTIATSLYGPWVMHTPLDGSEYLRTTLDNQAGYYVTNQGLYPQGQPAPGITLPTQWSHSANIRRPHGPSDSEGNSRDLRPGDSDTRPGHRTPHQDPPRVTLTILGQAMQSTLNPPRRQCHPATARLTLQLRTHTPSSAISPVTSRKQMSS